MLAKIFSSSLVGIEAQIIRVEVDLTSGLHSFNIVGLPDKAIGEARHRVSSAIKNSGMLEPAKNNQKVTVNLAPADIKKEGSYFDLAMALGYILASEQAVFSPKNKLFLGELSLNGEINKIPGALPAIIKAKAEGFEEVYLPKGNEYEARLVSDIRVFPVSTLNQTLSHLERRITLQPPSPLNLETLNTKDDFPITLDDIRGQDNAKFALKLAAAGGHNMLMIGPPGGGKTLLAQAIQSILPPLSYDEMVETTAIWSSAGKLSEINPWVKVRPFRNPHHTISEAALIGGGNPPRPGEITLAHRGVLFLDEFPEFHRDVLESLRQPLESGRIEVARSRVSVSFPARFIFITAQNPCPCGNWQNPSAKKGCACPFQQINKYQRKVSGPIGDRIDIHLSVPQVKPEDLMAGSSSETCETKKARQEVLGARAIQRERLKNENILTNSEMNVRQVERYCPIALDLRDTVLDYLKKHQFSARSYHKVLKLARTIADIEESSDIKLNHLTQAVKYRTMEI